MLSCEWTYEDYEDAIWWYNTPEDFNILETNRRKRCCSCKKLIDIGSECVEFGRARHTRSDTEERIYECDGVPLSSWYMCERCGEIFLNLDSQGYFIKLGMPMDELLKEYWKLTGFKAPKRKK